MTRSTSSSWVVDLDLGPKWEFNAGVGFGLTPSSDRLIVKMILGYRFDGYYLNRGSFTYTHLAEVARRCSRAAAMWRPRASPAATRALAPAT
jgi:hypothetical protein